MLAIQDIQRMIPHRYPFLLVDRIVEWEEGKRAVGWKQVAGTEPYFGGHGAAPSVVPGVLLVEALAQVGGIAISSREGNHTKLGLLASIDNCSFPHTVHLGDEVRLEFEVNRIKGHIVKGKGIAFVNQIIVCETEIMFALSTI
ncbi:3-hydroxyacyl-ACP dehydratase FabZ [Paenibacillus koleovorans]|uniref:3-hydroxyacyl-ACP dehydratase FabZ n=1 Tax=Paenibacillus koleovorans TaxID=121608 RepID=UPI000FD96063|nr:3-hydroxyacyl-ACP dehydratase FabZ [Paenibacillus koleovorans]